jgi:hypothetical protein
MATLKTIGLWAVGATLAALVGCGSQGSADGVVTPTPEQKSASQAAAAGGGPVDQTSQAATNALVENGAPGSTSSQTSSSALVASTTGINFQASVTVVVDLDALDASGNDPYPNASGKFQVTATGTITGDSMNGQASYAVDITWLTAGVFTDPVCGAQATVNSGSQLSYSLVIQWAKTDDLNWSIQATYDVSGSATGTVVNHLGRTWDVTGTVTGHASASFTRTAGSFGFTFSINGLKSIVITSGTEQHTVTFTLQAIDRVFVDIDGATFGPYTLAQVRWFFGLDCRG